MNTLLLKSFFRVMQIALPLQLFAMNDSSTPDVLPGVEKLIKDHNSSSGVQVRKENLAALFSEHVAQNPNADTFVLKNMADLNLAFKALNTDATLSKTTLDSLLVLYTVQNKSNFNSEVFHYAKNLFHATKAIAAHPEFKGTLGKDSILKSDDSLASKEFNVAIADSIAQALTTETFDRISRGEKATIFSAATNEEAIKERVDRFTSVKEMLLGDSNVLPSTFEKVLEIEKRLSESLASNPSFSPRETIEALKTVAENLSRSSLNTSLDAEAKVVGQELLLIRLISMIKNGDIKDVGELKNLVAISSVLKETLLTSSTFRDDFSNPNMFRSWLLEFIAKGDIKNKNTTELAALLKSSADAAIKAEKQKLVVNDRAAPPADTKKNHSL